MSDMIELTVSAKETYSLNKDLQNGRLEFPPDGMKCVVPKCRSTRIHFQSYCHYTCMNHRREAHLPSSTCCIRTFDSRNELRRHLKSHRRFEESCLKWAVESASSRDKVNVNYVDPKNILLLKHNSQGIFVEIREEIVNVPVTPSVDEHSELPADNKVDVEGREKARLEREAYARANNAASCFAERESGNIVPRDLEMTFFNRGSSTYTQLVDNSDFHFE